MADEFSNSVDYYRNRELRERDLAGNARSKPIRDIHLNMADRYRQMVEEIEAFNLSQAGDLEAESA